MKLKFLLVLSFLILGLFFINNSNAQISVDGTPLSKIYSLKSIPQVVTMPSVDVNKLKAEDNFEAQFKDIPPRFGFGFDVKYSIANSGTFEFLPDGTKIWRLTISCPTALAINLIFDKFYLPMGTSLFVYNKDKSTIIGAFTYLNNSQERVFSTAPVKGDEITLEFNLPWYVTEQTEISISRIVHVYKDFFKILKDYGGAGACNRNVVCPEGDPYRNQIRANAMILTAGNSRLCSGSMINNTRNDGTPFFITANHCVAAGTPSTWIIMFRYEAPSCANPGGDGPTTFTISGTTLLANNTFSDFGLLRLSSRPPTSYNIYYEGWNRSNVPATSGFGVHHPSGDVKKISFITTPNTPTSYNSPTVPGDSSHWHTTWASIPSTGLTPITEPGSSGSPVYDQNKRYIGQLHGGPSSCTASDKSDYYGKFDRSWNYGSTPSTRVKDWLDSLNTGAITIDGLDPNAGPLNAYNLQTPAASITITAIPNSTTPISFTWDTSSMGASYKWIFGTALPTRLITMPLFTNNFSLTLGQLDAMLAGIGVIQGDSISGSWDAWAFRNNAPINDSLKAANGPRAIKFKRQKPLLTSFSLVSPVSGARIETQAGLSNPINFNWTKSGTGTSFKLMYASPNFSSLANIKFRIQSNNSGFDSLLTKSSGEIDAILAGFGLAPGDSTIGQWRVYAYSGIDSLASTQTNNITFKRLPIGNITIGTGNTATNYPFTTFWHDERTQMLYTKSEILAAGGNGNLITRIGFDVVAAYPQVMNGFNIKMKNTLDSSMTYFDTTIVGWTTVFSGTYFVPGTGWQFIDLTTPFPYSIAKNLLIDICFDNTSYTTSSTVNGSTTTSQREYNKHKDNGTGCIMTYQGTVYTPPTRPNITLVMNLAVGNSGNTSNVPVRYDLSQNYPNPFNPTTQIRYDIPKQTFVTLKVYDMLGREITKLVSEVKQPGSFIVDFNASNLSSGVYFYKLQAGEFESVKRMVLLK